jgi:hypothetical protein
MPVELQIGAIALAPIIVGLVEVAKALGLDVKYAPWLTGGLALLAYAAVVAVQQRPELLQPMVYALNALIIFLVSTGFYNRAQAALRRKTINFVDTKPRAR